MTTNWPREEFHDYLVEKMKIKGIGSRAELARLTGVDASLISRWMSGKNQPTKENLRKIAPHLGVPVVALELKAGLTDPSEVDVQPDDRVLPEQFERAIDRYFKALRQYPDLVSGVLERVDYAADWFDVASVRATKTNRSK